MPAYGARPARSNSRWNAMVTNARIAAEAAELARQVWLEIEAELAWQIAQCRSGRPAQARMPGDSPPRDDESWRGWLARPAKPVGRNAQPLAG